jgi:signal transduction histidine kinase
MKIPLRVLFVEDNEQDLAMLLTNFALSEYKVTYSRVETANDMSDALKNETWDLIISDYCMPEFSGIEALRVAQESNMDYPFIIVSGNIGEETAVAAMKAGAHDYIFKGNLKRLMPAITRELREANTRHEHRLAQQEVERMIIDREKQLRALTSEISMAEERERRQLAIELHDQISQVLAFAKMEIRSAITKMELSTLPKQLEQIGEYIDQAYQQTKALTFELSPPILYDLGLISAVDWLAERVTKQHGLEITIEQQNKIPPLAHETAIVLFRSIRELLNNVVKHANAKQVVIYFYSGEEYINICVIDDGIGCDINSLNSQPMGVNITFGLLSIRERVQYMGGTMTCSTEIGQGTQIRISLPLTTIRE